MIDSAELELSQSCSQVPHQSRAERIVARRLSATRFVEALEAPYQFEMVETAVLYVAKSGFWQSPHSLLRFFRTKPQFTNFYDCGAAPLIVSELPKARFCNTSNLV